MRLTARRCAASTTTAAAAATVFRPPSKCNPRGPFPSVLLLMLAVLAGGFVRRVEADGKIPGVEISMPPSHTALSGDLHVLIKSSLFPPLLLQLSRLEGDATQTLTTFSVLPEARALSLNTTIVKIPCGYFSKGGLYYVLIKKQGTGGGAGGNSTTPSTTEEGDVITRGLDVRWPMPQLSLTPEHVQTYPESPVNAILEFPEVNCPPVADSAPSAIPEFWLELHYCGHSLLTCDSATPDPYNKTQVLYSEQVRGFPGRQVVTLRCELFGLAGHYSLTLRPTTPAPTLPHTAAYVKADWSDQFVFNVHARSIFPCETHTGIPVLFQYPSCILASGDRVRLFARLRANVASLAPPTTLEYVAEQRVTRGQHSLHFDCDLFSERYVEYCFVYVSQSLTGAVADVRMDCVPTLPVTESESGGWGPWSPWTPCSSTCIGGTRNRYRFCDSPPPRYGAKFCEGPTVETEKCGSGIGNSWECFYSSGISVNDIAAEIPEVQAEVGPYCRCGCVVHLGHAKPRRLLATSSQSCPGRTFWLIQADEDFLIEFKVEQFHLPCGTQWLKVRDGSLLSSTLLLDLSGLETSPAVVNSTGANILLEYFTDDISSATQFCGGGFLAHAVQIRPERNLTGVPVAQGVGVVPVAALSLTAVHMATIFFLSGLLIATALLGAQYVFRYRKYHIARADDQDSLADASVSCNSIPMTTRASSNATLLSEVISLTRLRPNIKNRNKHSRLRESMDYEKYDEQEVALAEEESMSVSSTLTLTQLDTTLTCIPPTTNSINEDSTSCSIPGTPTRSNSEGTLRRSSTVLSGSEKDRSTEKPERGRHLSNATLTNVSTSAGSPVATPVPFERRSKSDPVQYLNMIVPINDASLAPNDDTATSYRCCSAHTLTLREHVPNHQHYFLHGERNGCYSPAASIISTATIRSTNLKESKEKRNREKLLAGPGSDFSIAATDGDLEMDYYDYNVVNAGAAPGSYLGMDPAFLVWIPPLDESGEIIPEDDEDEILPKHYRDPGSNKESPEEETLLPKKNTPILGKKCCKKVHPLVVIENKGSTESVRFFKNEPIVSIQLQEFPIIKLGSPVKVHKPIDSNLLDDIKYADDEDTDQNEAECNNDIPYQDSNILSSG